MVAPNYPQLRKEATQIIYHNSFGLTFGYAKNKLAGAKVFYCRKGDNIFVRPEEYEGAKMALQLPMKRRV